MSLREAKMFSSPFGIFELKDDLKLRGKQIFSRALKWQKYQTSVRQKECDLVVTFNQKTQYNDICWFHNVLQERVPQLIVRLNYHKQSGQYAMYLAANYSDLLAGAEAISMRKQLISDFGGGMREFCLEDSELFQNVQNPALFFTSQQRSCIIHHYVMSLRANEGECFGDKHKFAASQNITHALQSTGLIRAIFPLHDQQEMKRLNRMWVGNLSIIKQPIALVEQYFGVRIALYFAWLGHYTKALFVFSLFSLFAWLYLHSSKNYNVYYMITALFNIVWATLYLEHWRRTSSHYAYKWGTLDQPPQLLEEARPSFKGKLGPCPITGRMVPQYPSWKRKLIGLLVSGPVTLICIVGVIFLTFCLMELQYYTDQWITKEQKLQPKNARNYTWLSYGPKVLYALCIMIADAIYRAIAVKLTELENHRLEDTHRNYLIGKLILFQFVNSFYLLFYTAFVMQDMKLLKQQLSTILIVRQFTGNCKEIFLPIGQTRLKQFYLSLRYEQRRATKEESTDQAAQDQEENVSFNSTNSSGAATTTSEDDTNTVHLRSRQASSMETGSSSSGYLPVRNRADSIDGTISQPEQEAILPEYDDSAEDYLEMLIQFGYVSLFACVFPMASILAFINNIVEIRSDAYKLTTAFKRPIAKPAPNIGVWQVALDVVSYLAVATNIGLLYVSGSLDNYLPSLSDTDKILLLVFLEHCVFAIRFIISQMIPDQPAFIENEVAILEHKRREALKTLEREALKEQQRLLTEQQQQQ